MGRRAGYNKRITLGVSGGAATLVIFLTGALTLVAGRNAHNLVIDHARSLAASLAGNSALGALSGRDEFLQRPVQVAFVSKAVLQASIYDQAGDVLYEHSSLDFRQPADPPQLARVLRLGVSEEHRFETAGGDAVSVIAPIITRRMAVEPEEMELFMGGEPEEVVVGAAQVVYSLKRLEALQWTLFGSGLMLGLLLLAVGVTFSFWLEAQVSRPIQRLLDGVRRIAGGDLDYTVTTEERGELRELTDAFNVMARKLKSRQEELRKANEEMEEYVSIASHDLQSPLISIQGYSDLLLEEKRQSLDPAAAGWLERISANASAMRGLIRSLLGFARTGRHAIDFRPAESRAILHAALELHRSAIDQRGITLEVGGDHPVLECDPDQMRLAISNLVDNAVKYIAADNPAPRIRVSAESTGGRAVFRVEDNGIGIAPEHLDRIFRPMERLDAMVHGSGMGLALVRKIARRHQGEVTVTSTPGTGSTFTLEVPLSHGST